MSGAQTQAVATRTPEDIAKLLDENKVAIARSLPKILSHTKLQQVVLNEIRKTPKLLECEPMSLFNSVILCAQLGLVPGGTLGQAYLVPFWNNKNKRNEVQFIPGYRGLIELALRSGKISSITANAVHANDEFICQEGTVPELKHVRALANRGAIIAFYAVAKFRDGTTQFEVMSVAEVEAIRDASEGYKASVKFKFDNPWKSHFSEMGRKTAIRRLVKYLPVSMELQQALRLDDAAESGESQEDIRTLNVAAVDVPMDEDPADVIDAVVERDDGYAVERGSGEVVSQAPETTTAAAAPADDWKMDAKKHNDLCEAARAEGLTLPDDLDDVMQAGGYPPRTRDLKREEYDRLLKRDIPRAGARKRGEPEPDIDDSIPY